MLTAKVSEIKVDEFRRLEFFSSQKIEGLTGGSIWPFSPQSNRLDFDIQPNKVNSKISGYELYMGHFIKTMRF